ncbi:hypothetical protein OV203_44185 [Nannocystis sp. ILAH1]|nr:hypothetical protein [Nannocystis sp. ILAH1]MCY0994211.1 hypothetical protein [Nannocystis sp. ILAH1]
MSSPTLYVSTFSVAGAASGGNAACSLACAASSADGSGAAVKRSRSA